MEKKYTESNKRDFKGIWIPRHIWYNKKISIRARVLLAEIDSFDHSKKGGKYCFASNKYFAEFFGISQSSVKRLIAELAQHRFVKQVGFNGRIRFLKSLI